MEARVANRNDQEIDGWTLWCLILCLEELVAVLVYPANFLWYIICVVTPLVANIEHQVFDFLITAVFFLRHVSIFINSYSYIDGTTS